MADQKALKKRLKVLMSRPENQTCSECPERKPTWASLIVAPPGIPSGTGPIGAFCCLECSGSHRRLGVHISFVRSVNLDSWKEKEVRSMENGGNAKVNAIFEARLAESGKTRLTNLADGPTRERFIRDKYERRKFYDPAGYALAGNSGGGVAQAPNSGPAPTARSGAPSDVARQRVATRQARMKPSQSQTEAPARVARQAVAKAPVSAPVPVMLDLLDFAASEPAPATATAAAANDPFAAPLSSQAAPDPFALQAPAPQQQTQQPPMQQQQTPQQQAQAHQQPQAFAPTPGQEFLTAAPAMPAASNASIMALFNTPAQQTGYGMQGMPGMQNSNNMMAGGMMPQQMGGMTNANNMQQQQMMMQNMMMNPQGMNPQMMAMMNNNMQMMQQQQNQPQMNNMMAANNSMGGMMNNSGMSNNSNGAMNNNSNSMMQQMQQMHMGNQQQPQQTNDNGGFGTPMGGESQSKDPFSSLGGMNAFH